MGKANKQSAIKARNKELKLRGIPRRPLSSYNMFFAIQRKKIVDEQQLSAQKKNGGHANVGFANLANIVAQQWKNVDPTLKAELEDKARQDKIRYKTEMREWEMKQKMEADLEEIKADLETTETEVKTKSEVGDLMIKIKAMKKELEQIKQMSNETKVHQKAETIPDAKSKTCEVTEVEYSRKDCESPALSIDKAMFMKEICDEEKKETVPDAESKTEEDTAIESIKTAIADIDEASQVSPAADIDEALAFLKETLDTPMSRRATFDGTAYTPVHTRNVFGASEMTESRVPPSLIFMDIGAVTPSPIQYCSPCISHEARFALARSYPKLPFQSPCAAASRFASTNSMLSAIGEQAPFAQSMYMSGTGAPRWPPLSELQRFFGIKSCSEENVATE